MCNCHSIFRTVKNYPTEIKRVTFEKHCENLVKYARTFKKKNRNKKDTALCAVLFRILNPHSEFPIDKAEGFRTSIHFASHLTPYKFGNAHFYYPRGKRRQ